MLSLDFLRRRNTGAAPPSPPEPRDGSANLAIERYDGLEAQQVTARLSRLSQTELVCVEYYERCHLGRYEVLAELLRLRGTEPFPGYDQLDAAQIATALRGADDDTLELVRSYEMRLHRRVGVLDEVARLSRERALGGAA